MANNDVEIKVKVDDQGAVTFFDKFDNKLKEVEAQSAKTGSGFSGLQASIITLNQTLELGRKGFDIIRGAMEGLADGINFGDKLNDVNEAFDTLTKKAGATSEVLMNELRSATSNTVTDFDLMRRSNELLQAGLKPDAIVEMSKAARIFAKQDGKDFAEEMDQITDAMVRGNDKALKAHGIIIDNNKAFTDYAASIGVSVKMLDEQDKATALRIASQEALNKKILESGTVQDSAGDKIEQAQIAVKNAFADVWKAVAGEKGVLSALTDLSAYLRDTLPAAAKATITTISTIIELLGKLPKKTAEWTSNVKAQLSNPITAFEQFEKLVIKTAGDLGLWPSLMQKLSTSAQPVATETKNLATNFEDIHKSLLKADEGLTSFVAGLAPAPKKVRELTDEMKKNIAAAEDWAVNGPARFAQSMAEAVKKARELQKANGSIFDQMFTVDQGTSKSEAIGTAYMSSISNAISQAQNGDGGKKIIKSIDETLYTAWGASIGGPAGAIIGNMVGKLAGEIDAGIYGQIKKALFGGGNKETEARKTVDKYFADLFDHNRLSVIVDGELKQISDMTFGKGESFGSGEAFSGFNALEDNAKQAFAGIGAAFEQMIGNADLASGQLAAVIVNNIGGSLNNLQLFVEATGKSFEEMSNAIVDAFLNGQLSALEAQSALLGIQQIAEKGIPGALGATTEALDNFFAAGSKGGRATINDLQDIGFEAKELSIKTFPDLIKNLTASGKYSADTIDKVFEALKANGIDSIDKLTAATAKDLIPVLSQLQAEGVLSEAANSAADLATKINQLPSSKDVEINLKINTIGDVNALNQAAAIQGRVGASSNGVGRSA